ncbi:MAG: RNA recognition motif domain-containing protein [Nanoarchaeota archaeon]
MKLFVGNLPWSIRNEKLKEIFSEAGNITDAVVITDKFSNKSKGFGFVEFSNEEDAKKAIELFNGKEVEGRELKVDKAQPKSE